MLGGVFSTGWKETFNKFISMHIYYTQSVHAETVVFLRMKKKRKETKVQHSKNSNGTQKISCLTKFSQIKNSFPLLYLRLNFPRTYRAYLCVYHKKEEEENSSLCPFPTTRRT